MAKKKKTKQPGIIVVLVGLVGAAALFMGSIRGCGGMGRGSGDGDGTSDAAPMHAQSRLFITVRVTKDTYVVDGATVTLDALLKQLKASKKKVKVIYNKGSYATAVDKLEAGLKAEGIHPVTEREK